MSELLDRVRTGDTAGAAALLADLTPEQRRAELPGLRARRRELRDSWSGRGDAWTALLVAGAACHTAPTAAADWLGSRVFEDFGSWKHPALLEVVERQSVEWRTTVLDRLAARRAPGWGRSEHFRLLEHLVRTLDCPVPTADPFVVQWQRDRAFPRFDGGRPVGPGLHARLAADPFTPVLAPRLFEVAEIGSELDGPWSEPEDGRWPAVLARLAADGVLDRTDLLDRCLARLLRGGRPADQRVFLLVLRALAPDQDEYAARVRTLVGLLDGHSTVAAHAQQALVTLDAAGRLASEVPAEVSPTVLFRPEKKLVRAQLGWLDRTARTSPDRAGPVVLAAAGAFGHADRGLQEQALKVIARHLAAAGPAVLPALREAADQLDPAHHGRAAELFGAEVRTEEYGELLPPVPRPRPVPPPVATPAELAEELGAVLAGEDDVVTFERVLDGLVRHAWSDRPALAEALAPVLRVGSWHRLHLVAEAAAGLMDPGRAHAVAHGREGGLRGHHGASGFEAQLASRVEETIWRLTARPLPYLLATPTLATGALDAAVLVERLAGYERLGVAAGPVDLAQAMLRVAPDADPAAVAAAGRLESPEGERLADWLRTGGLPRPSSALLEPSSARGPAGRRLSATRRLVEQPAAAGIEGFPRDTAQLLGPAPLHDGPSPWWEPEPGPHWPAVLPHHREEVAARLLRQVAAVADLDSRGAARVLPHLAEADGPAGLALHLAVVYGLGARHPEDRTAAVDALLVLAARGDLDGALLGREAAELVLLGGVKPNRLAAALRAAADTGAYGTVWSVLAAALPRLLGGAPPRAVGELLAIGVDCAGRSAARGPIAEVTAAAGRGGTARTAREAQALAAVLAG
jgi:hypothetical protein